MHGRTTDWQTRLVQNKPILSPFRFYTHPHQPNGSCTTSGVVYNNLLQEAYEV